MSKRLENYEKNIYDKIQRNYNKAVRSGKSVSRATRNANTRRSAVKVVAATRKSINDRRISQGKLPQMSWNSDSNEDIFNNIKKLAIAPPENDPPPPPPPENNSPPPAPVKNAATLKKEAAIQKGKETRARKKMEIELQRQKEREKFLEYKLTQQAREADEKAHLNKVRKGLVKTSIKPNNNLNTTFSIINTGKSITGFTPRLSLLAPGVPSPPVVRVPPSVRRAEVTARAAAPPAPAPAPPMRTNRWAPPSLPVISFNNIVSTNNKNNTKTMRYVHGNFSSYPSKTGWQTRKELRNARKSTENKVGQLKGPYSKNHLKNVSFRASINKNFIYKGNYNNNSENSNNSNNSTKSTTGTHRRRTFKIKA
jgi:hypothetical protein